MCITLWGMRWLCTHIFLYFYIEKEGVFQMFQSYFLFLLRNLCSSSLSVMFILETPATKKDTHAWAQLQPSGTWDLAKATSHGFQTFRESLKHQWPKHYSGWWQMEKTVWKRCKEEKQAGLQGASCCGLTWHTDLLGLLKSPFGCKDDAWPNMLSPSIPKPDTMGVWDRWN